MKHFIHVTFKEIEEEIKKDIASLTIKDSYFKKEDDGFVLTAHYKASEPYIKEILAKLVEAEGYRLISSKISDEEDEYLCEVDKKDSILPILSVSSDKEGNTNVDDNLG